MTAQVRELEVYFETGSFALNPSQTGKLEIFIASLSIDREKSTINIAGHTDNVGDLAYNAVLSEKRADAIASIFRNNGFNDSAILTSGRGEVHPIADNRTEIGKAKNRRVRIVVSDSNPRSSFIVDNIGGLKLSETRYVIDPSREQKLNYRSGSKIHIPKNAFVDRTGKIVKGKIIIRYIEYRDPIDFMLSNISMEHDGGHFNSGGMFKICAYQGKHEVFLKDGQKIDIDFRLTADLPNMGFYQYDTISKTWTERSRLPTNRSAWADAVLEDEGYSCPTEPCDIYQMLTFTPVRMIRFGGSAHADYISELEDIEAELSKNPQSRPPVHPETVLGTEYASSARALQQLENGIIVNEHEAKKAAFEIAKTGSHYAIVRIGKGNRKHKFKIVPDVPNPKAADLEQTVWTYKGGLSSKVFDQQWLSCVISGGDDHYVLNLKNQSETLVLKNVKMKNKSVSNRDEQKLVTNFNESLESQAAKLGALESQKSQAEKNILLYRKKIERIKKSDFDQGGEEFPTKCFWQFSRKYMPENEKAMFAEEWLDYFDANKALIAARYAEIPVPEQCLQRERFRQEFKSAQSAAENLTRSLQISNLGIYNCDQVQRIYEPMIAEVEYRDNDGNTIKPTMIYILDSRLNGILRYDAGGSISPDHFWYGSKSENTLLAFAGSDSYIINKETFKKSMAGKAAYLTLTKIGKITDKRELAKLF